MKICEKCCNEHKGTFGSGRFCSRSCANSKIQTSDMNQKRSQTLKERNFQKRLPRMQKVCTVCGCSFLHFRRKTCSKECNLAACKTPETIQKLSEKAKAASKIRHERGDSFGWKTRKKLEPSYPERVAMNCLDFSGIPYERECKVGKFFIDFALHEKSIAIEIDGQQHGKPERQISDAKKDSYLTSKGWQVFRIKWPQENIIQRINEILSL